MLSVAIDGEIKLWDAQKREIIHTVHNRVYMIAKSINTSYFCKDTGSVILATTKIFRWNLKKDPQMTIISE